MRVPLVVAAGRDAGPRVALVAGVHGDEVEGQFALQDLALELDPGALRGKAVLVLCANPLAALRGQRCTPTDGIDLNRVFPGEPQGGISQRLAAALFDLVRGAQLVMTLHSWYAAGEVLPYVEVPQGSSPAAVFSLEAARASGLGRIMTLDWHPGLLPAAAVRAGIPAIEAEIGGRGESRPQNRALYRRVILNVLRHCGVLAGEPEPASSVRALRPHHLPAPVGGWLRAHVGLGQPVQGGQPVASIVDLSGRILAELAAPVSGEVGAVRHFARVCSGDRVMSVFEEM